MSSPEDGNNSDGRDIGKTLLVAGVILVGMFAAKNHATDGQLLEETVHFAEDKYESVFGEEMSAAEYQELQEDEQTDEAAQLPEMGGFVINPDAPSDDVPKVEDEHPDAKPTDKPKSPEDETEQEEQIAPVKHVIVISVSGLRTTLIRNEESNLPGFYRLINQGASTLNGRALPESTGTWANELSLLTGMPQATKYGHHVTDGDNGEKTVHDIANKEVHSVFSAFHDNGKSTAFLSTNPGMAEFVFQSWNEQNGPEDTTGKDDGRDKIDFEKTGTTKELFETLLQRLKNSPDDLTYLSLDNMLKTGKEYGFRAEQSHDEIKELDALLLELEKTIQDDKYLRKNTALVVVTPHGATTDEFTDTTAPDNYTTFLGVLYDGVAEGQDLYALNAEPSDEGIGRLNPGEQQVGYDDPRQPIRSEVANLALDLVGLEPVENSSFNVFQDLETREIPKS